MKVLKRRKFAKWQTHVRLSGVILRWAVMRMEHGLVDADLGKAYTRNASLGWAGVKAKDIGL